MMNTLLTTYWQEIVLMLCLTSLAVAYQVQRRRYTHRVLSLESALSEKETILEYARESEQKAREELLQQNRSHVQLLTRLNRVIRTQMNSVIGMSTVLETSSATDEQARHARSIARSGHELISSVDEMMRKGGILAALIEPEHPASDIQVDTPAALSVDFAIKYPLKILIAEDDRMNQEMTMMILGRLGYKADIANNGNEVLELVSDKKYDCILMDLEMPGMNGLEATKMIRLCLDAQPFIVAMTANAIETDKLVCLEAGMNEYLCKPLNIEELMSVLKKGFKTAPKVASRI